MNQRHPQLNSLQLTARRRGLFSIFLSAFFCASFVSLVSAQSATNASPAAEERVLLIVETSSATQKRAENIQKIVGDTISSGMGGDMRDGDTLGFWTFNDELSTGKFPLQRWTKSSRQRVAVAAVQFLQQQKFDSAPKLPVVWDALTNVIANSERITIILVTSGAENVKGTPFDGSIAQNFLKNAAAQQKARMPFVTILRAYRGAFVNFSVSLPPWPMELPEYPEAMRRPPEIIPPKPAAAPVVKAVPPRPSPIAHTTIYAANIPAMTNEIVTDSNSLPTTTSPVASIEPTNQAASIVAAQTTPPEQQKTSVSDMPDATTHAASVQSQPSPLPVKMILVAGIALLLGIMVIFISLLRWTRRSAGESLITRSMTKR